METIRKVYAVKAEYNGDRRDVLNGVSVNKLAFIDSLRGIAILMVMLVHTAQSVPGLAELTKYITEYGQMGVQLFFILSAYTICLSLDKRKNEASPILFFYIRRYFRIAPLYYCGILMYYSLNLVLGYSTSNYTFKNILSNVFFYHGFYQPANNNIVYGGWSIGTEMAFYAIVPFLFLGVKRFCNRKWAILALPFIVVLMVLGAFALLSSIDQEIQVWKGSFYYYNLLNQLPVFLIGISYYCLETFATPQRAYPRFVDFFIFIALTGLSIYLFSQDTNFTLVPFLSGIAFIFLLNVFRHSTTINWRVLRRIGQLSFSMYIFHFLFAWYGSEYIMKHVFKSIFLPEVSLLICFGFTLLMTMIIAIISERTIEHQGIKVGKQIIANT